MYYQIKEDSGQTLMCVISARYMDCTLNKQLPYGEHISIMSWEAKKVPESRMGLGWKTLRETDRYELCLTKFYIFNNR